MSNPIPYRIVEIIVNGFNVQSDENLDKNIEINKNLILKTNME